MRKIRKISVLLGVVLLSTNGIAEEIKEIAPESTVTTEQWPLVQASDEESKKYRGVATMNNDGYSCTAFVVRPPGCMNYKTQKAIVMTNGHCTKSLDANGVTRSTQAKKKEKLGDPNRILRDKSATGMEFTFGDFAGAKEEERVKATSTKVLYASMKEKDVAMIEINMTYAELEAKEIPSYKMADSSVPQEITTVGRPFEKTPDTIIFHRKAQCQLEKKVGLIEGDWYWPEAISTNCPSQKGSSGSPMFNSKGEVVGIVNTGTSNPGPGSPRCPANSPCEIDKDAKHNYVPYKTYGFETGPLNNCFQQCKWTVAPADCDLAKESAPAFKQSGANMQTLKIYSPLPAPYTNAKYRLVPLGNGDCTTAGEYTEIPPSPLGVMYDSKNRDPEGKYHLCLIGGIQQSDGTIKWDGPGKAYAKTITIDRTPPEVDVTIHGTTLAINYKDRTDMGAAGFGYKKVKNAKECEKQKDYAAHKGPPLKLPTGDTILCIKAQDSAGNWQINPTMFNAKGPL